MFKAHKLKQRVLCGLKRVSQARPNRSYSTEAAVDSNAKFKHPKLQRSEELVQEAQELIVKGDWVSVFSMLETALEIQSVYQGDLKGAVATNLYYLLGIASLRLNKLPLAEENFQNAIDNVKSKTDKESKILLSLVYFNYSQLLAAKNNFQDAIEYVQDSIKLFDGSNKSLTLAQITNLSIYLVNAGRLEDAKVKSEEALNVAISDLGRDNKFTRTSFANLYLLLQKLGDEKGIKDLENKWDTCDKISSEHVKGIDTEDFKDIVEELSFSIRKTQPLCVPHGPVKGSSLYKEELHQFVELWKSRGNTIDESACAVLEQEFDAIKAGEKTRARLTNAIEKQKRIYAVQEKKAIEAQIDNEMKVVEDYTLRRDQQIFQTEEQFMTQILDAGEIGFGELDAPDRVERVIPYKGPKLIHFDETEKEVIPEYLKAENASRIAEKLDEIDEIDGDNFEETVHKFYSVVDRGLLKNEVDGSVVDRPKDMSETEWRIYVAQMRKKHDDVADYENRRFARIKKATQTDMSGIELDAKSTIDEEFKIPKDELSSFLEDEDNTVHSLPYNPDTYMQTEEYRRRRE